MSAVASTPTMDVSGTVPISFARMVRVELRKMFDTRAGMWLVISIAALTAVVLVIMLAVVVSQDVEAEMAGFMTGVNTPMGILLPVLGIMAVTSEWSQRTAMVTFTLEPFRARVVAAKFAATVLIAVAAIIIGLLLAALTNVLYGAFSDYPVVWDVGVVDVLYYFMLHLFGMATGFAFGTLLLNTPAAIVIYFVYSFVLPAIFGTGAALLEWFSKIQPWIDFNAAQAPLLEGSLSGEDWAHLAVAGAIWLVLPLAVGIWRVLRAEVK